ncbi:DUF202 domain-containing protein [Corynebacterium tapiri]|uniref:DUF202 domain-containing protein n=1 Tax=Corynebacterium tapiri TaxID=1448266 RepID=UPI0015D5F415|nr:DUF202 domain-containing protein [Corynebacterium tapiri]
MTHGDPGLQPERTALSWTRTLLALLVLSLTYVRFAREYPGVIWLLVVLIAVTSSAIVLGQRRRYVSTARGLDQEVVEPKVLSVAAMSVAIGVLALLEVGLIALDG